MSIPQNIIDFIDSQPIFQNLDKSILPFIQNEMEIVKVQGGEELIRQGDIGDSMYLVVKGRFKVFHRNLLGEEISRGESGKGETLGEMALLTGEKRAETVIAVRESEVLKLSKKGFDALLRKNPLAAFEIARFVISRLNKKILNNNQSNNLSALSFFPFNQGAPVSELCQELKSVLLGYGSTILLNDENINSILNISISSEIDLESAELKEKLFKLERENRFIIFQSDSVTSPWGKLCFRQADRIFLVGTEQFPPGEIEESIRFCFDIEPKYPPRIELILVHENNVESPSGTNDWLANNNFSAHHHIKLNLREHIERLGRWVTGNTIGVALGGGGARGLAHIGSLRAFNECGIPIDYIGGTSMGSVIAAQFAMGWDFSTMMDVNRKIWIELNPLKCFTIPFISIVGTKKAHKAVKIMFGEIQTVDLWIPYFCISTNISQGKPMVHSVGKISENIKASCSIPGIMQPVYFEGDLLVDGMVINNLPGDIMKNLCGGHVIAVDVSVEKDLTTKLEIIEKIEKEEGFSLNKIILNKLNPWVKKLEVPTLIDILERTIQVPSIYHKKQEVESKVDLYLHIPLDKFRNRDFESLEKIVETGYQYSLPIIKKWKNSNSANLKFLA